MRCVTSASRTSSSNVAKMVDIVDWVSLPRETESVGLNRGPVIRHHRVFEHVTNGR